MKEKLNQIHKYLISEGYDATSIQKMDKDTVSLSKEIMMYAHRNQRRENGEKYMMHPTRCFERYRKLIGVVPENNFGYDIDLLNEFGLPYFGVQEVCLMHDVIEDTEFSIDDIKDIFAECGFKEYFESYIKIPLINVTHDENDDYETFIKKCMTNPISMMVKLCDLQDNINIFSLTELNKDRYLRAKKYLKCLFIIDEKCKFIETAHKYLKAYQERKN